MSEFGSIYGDGQVQKVLLPTERLEDCIEVWIKVGDGHEDSKE